MAHDLRRNDAEASSPAPAYERPDRAFAIICALFVIAFATPFFLPQADVLRYHAYAEHLLHGPNPLRFPVEYPALSSLVFLLPLALPVSYDLAFAVCMALALAALVLVGRAYRVGPAWLGRLGIYLALGTATVLFARFDLVPACFTFVAVLEARRARYGRAWTAAVVGGLLKVFPFALLPGFFIAEWRARGVLPWRRAVVSGASVAAFGFFQDLVVHNSALHPLRYEVHRGFEFSSVPGTITALFDPAHLTWAVHFGNTEIVGAGADAIRVLVTACAIGMLVAVWALAWRGRIGVAEVSVAALSVLVITDRSLAPQYLVWLAPLWALWPLRRSWAAAAVLSTCTYPVVFILGPFYAHSLLPETIVGGARNVVLVAGTVAWFVDVLKIRAKAAV